MTEQSRTIIIRKKASKQIKEKPVKKQETQASCRRKVQLQKPKAYRAERHVDFMTRKQDGTKQGSIQRPGKKPGK